MTAGRLGIAATFVAVAASTVMVATALSKPSAVVECASAAVGGKLVCLKTGAACKPRYDSAYRRHGFTCPAGRLRRVTAPSVTPTTPTPPAPPVGTARSNPIPLGAPGTTYDGWRVTVTGINFDAWPMIQAANSYNDPPPAGSVDVLVSVSLTYVATGSARADTGYALRAVGASNVAYTGFGNDCGVLPDSPLSFSGPEVFTGGTVAGYGVCWQINASDIPSLEMFYGSGIFTTSTWFALH